MKLDPSRNLVEFLDAGPFKCGASQVCCTGRGAFTSPSRELSKASPRATRQALLSVQLCKACLARGDILLVDMLLHVVCVGVCTGLVVPWALATCSGLLGGSAPRPDSAWMQIQTDKRCWACSRCQFKDLKRWLRDTTQCCEAKCAY